MAKSKILDRITISFYDEVEIHTVLLKALNKVSAPRLRGAKLKEWAYNYIKSDTKLFNEIMQDDKLENKSEIVESKKADDKRNKLKSKLNVVTADD